MNLERDKEGWHWQTPKEYFFSQTEIIVKGFIDQGLLLVSSFARVTSFDPQQRSVREKGRQLKKIRRTNKIQLSPKFLQAVVKVCQLLPTSISWDPQS